MIAENDPLRVAEIRRCAEGLGITAVKVINSRDQSYPLLAEPFDFAVISIALRYGFDEEGSDLIRDLHSRQRRCGIAAISNHGEDAVSRALRAGATYFVNTKRQDWREQIKEKLGDLISIYEDVYSKM